MTDLYINEMIDIDIYKEQYKKLNDDLTNELSKKAPIKRINIKEIEKMLDKDILKNYKLLENEEKRKIWLSIIDTIIISNKKDIQINLIDFY